MQVKAHATLREEIDGLFIRPELFGAQHVVPSRAGPVIITLPAAVRPDHLEQRESDGLHQITVRRNRNAILTRARPVS